jgi:hypothetical protein
MDRTQPTRREHLGSLSVSATAARLPWALAIMLVSQASGFCQETPKKVDDSKEREWVQQFVGEWEAESSGTKVIDTARRLGPWVIVDIKVEINDSPLTGMLTVGFDSHKKKYVGTWIDSKTNYLWVYEGAVDSTGKVLTLETEGPNPMVPGKLVKAKDVHKFIDKDHRSLTSSMLGEDGKWHTFQTVDYRRKK